MKTIIALVCTGLALLQPYKSYKARFMFMPNGRFEFVPRDQVFPLFSVHSLLLLHKYK